jgi:putative hydrolase of the HAD superfamily
MKPGRRIEAVTFDCWNTLLRERDFKPPRKRRAEALVETAAAAGVALDTTRAGDAVRAAFERHLALWMEGVGSGAGEIARWALEAVGVADAAERGPDLARRFEDAALAGDVDPLPGAREVLERLRSRGVRVALICDTGMSPGRVVRELLRGAGLLENLEVQIFSNEVGVPKPHPLMFERALAPFGISPANAVHVGDLRRTDVHGGRAFGMGTVRIRGAFDDTGALPDADAVVDAHADLLETLEALR